MADTELKLHQKTHGSHKSQHHGASTVSPNLVSSPREVKASVNGTALAASDPAELAARAPGALFSSIPISVEKYAATRAKDVTVELHTASPSTNSTTTFRFVIEGAGWLGNIVQRLRCAMRNPTDDMIRQTIVPPAWAILRNCRAARALNGPGLASVPTVTLEHAIEGALRFLLGEAHAQMKALVKTALLYYPTDLRLYKLVCLVACPVVVCLCCCLLCADVLCSRLPALVIG